MKTIDKFVLKSYLGPMILTFFIVMFVLILQFLWRYIDELVGKGLSTGVVLELMMYAAATLMHMGLPLATLLGAIMTMGNLGENYELLAMKSAGMSLPRIMRPLVIVVGLIAVGSFFIANNLQPYAMKKMVSILYDINNQKQQIEFQDGLFFNGIDNMSIRVGTQDPETKLLTDVLIYDTRDVKGDMTTTIAETGYIMLSDDKRYLLVTLFNGETYEQNRGRQWFTENTMNRYAFTEQNMVLPLSGFDFTRTDSDMFTTSQTQTIAELSRGIDSLNRIAHRSNAQSYEPLLKNFLFVRNKELSQDTVKVDLSWRHGILLTDSISKLDVRTMKQIWQEARTAANTSRSALTYDEQSSKEALNLLYRYQVEWHRKMSLPVSIMIFFLIGAPLGAIIRKGGLGMPIVVSVIFFVLYYIVSMTGEKLAREGSWTSFMGMWFSTFILLPLSFFLTYKATKDSNLFNADWYYMKYQKVKAWAQHSLKKEKKKEIK